MKFFKRAAIVAGLLTFAAACSQGNMVSFRNEAKVGGYDVSWADASAMAGSRSDGLTPMMFIIVAEKNANSAPAASLEQRQKLAQAALGADPKCEWAGFDPALNTRMSQLAGGAAHTLYALARCQ